MSVCNYIQLVTPNTCLGDSLATFNSNFSALDEGLCRQPDIVGGLGTNVQLQITEQNHNLVEVSTNNSFLYNTTFDYVSAGTVNSIGFRDGTSINVTTLPYASGALAAFNTISTTRSAPKVSFFWTASGTNNTTVYLTNSATFVSTDIGNINLNGSVTSFLSSGNYVYVGGNFTTPSRKLIIANLNGGTNILNIGPAGSLVSTTLSGDGGFGLTGTINSIIEYQDLIIFGGTYQSLKMGRGLTIYNKNTDTIYPFYVNGEVNSLHINGTDLYIGGSFDYLNYLAESASVISGLRRNTNGLAKISLSLVEAFPNSAISSNFGANVINAFNNKAIINSIVSNSTVIYIGGMFTAHSGSNLVAANIAIINGDGTINLDWSPVIVGEVNCLAINGSYLYAGGEIKSVYTGSQFFAAPRKLDVSYNLVSFDITNSGAPVYEYNWKPRINGSVNKIAFHDQELSSYVYIYGNFTKVNNLDVGYIAAVDKPFNNNKNGQSYILWKNMLNKPPHKINNALIRTTNSILVGGNFDAINESNRNKFARITGVYETPPMPMESLKYVCWTLGAQLCNPGSSLALNLTNTTIVTAYPGSYSTVNCTTFPNEYTSAIFQNYSEGSLLRFFLRRPSSADTLTSPAHIIGWKVDFN